MSILFDRIARVIIGVDQADALVFDEKFKITFDVRKDTTSLPNNATISIFNLSDDDREKIKNVIHKNKELSDKGQSRLPLLLYAGYSKNIGYELLFSGDMTAVIDTYKGTDVETQISTGDGAIALRDTFINLSFAAGISMTSIVTQLSDILKMDIDQASNYLTSNIDFANGFSFTGKAKDCMDRIIKSANLTWHIEKNKIVIIPNDKSTTDQIIELDKTSGMIGSPEKVIESGTNVINPGHYDGWNVKSLLRPEINPGRLVKIVSRVANITMAVRTIEHKGDTRSGDWFSKIEARSLIV
jgi:hypothetical protein